jgi:hypothetical protein
MFRQKHTVFIGIALIMNLGLIGCTTGKSDLSSTSTPSASDVDPQPLTLEEATVSYENFQRTRDLVLSDGGRGSERITDSASGDALEEFIVDAQDFESRGWRLVGNTTFDSVTVQLSNRSEIAFYVCDDISGTDLLDRDGNSLVKPDRVNRSPWAVGLTMSSDGTLKVSTREFWAGENFCD